MAKTPTGKVTKEGLAWAKKHGLGEGSVKGLTASDVAGLEIVEDNTEEIISTLRTSVGRALEEIGIVAEGFAKKLCPVKTGRLRNSITHAVDIEWPEGYAVIGTNVEYSPWVEFGGRGEYKGANGGRGYLRPAANDHGDTYRKIIEKHLTNA